MEQSRLIISTALREWDGSILANQIDSVEACLAGTGASEIGVSRESAPAKVPTPISRKRSFFGAYEKYV